MRYSCKYQKNIRLNEFDETRIIYQRQNRELVQFLQEHKDKDVVLIITQEELSAFIDAYGWELLNAIKTRYPELNFSICFGEPSYFTLAPAALTECLEQLQVPFFCGSLITTFEQLHYMCKLGVSQVYLAGAICFDLRRAKRVCDRYGVKIRVVPNIVQSDTPTIETSKQFFIRPEDVDEYAEYIDILEFGGTGRQDLLLKIYKSKSWPEDLAAIIVGFKETIKSRNLLPEFGQARKTCDRKCLKGESCAICERLFAIAHKIEEVKAPKNT